ncbi:hypothetical protein GTV15_03505 [Streptomyces sp. SID7803]|nr:hypothetical protein [Streptomyces sp. SID7803]
MVPGPHPTVTTSATSRHRRARRLLAHPDPVLRPAAAPAGPRVHPGLGGCDIGGRPIDFHFDVLRQFGATIEKRADGSTWRPAAAARHQDPAAVPVGGSTEQVLLTAVLAEGVTELSNAAVEPEIEDLICVLQKMGAIISMDTDRTIRITGVDRLDGYTHRALRTAWRPPPGRPPRWPPRATSTSGAPSSAR